jgi:superfamily II DNA or RNA helicase
MACGTGKTLASLFIKEKLDAERVLVLVPSLSLPKQTMQVWRVNHGVKHSTSPTRREAGITPDSVILLSNILRRVDQEF